MRLLWISVTLLLGLSFPIQVYLKSPLPSLFPYLVFTFAFLLSLLNQRIGIPSVSASGRRQGIAFTIHVYLLLLLINTGWQVAWSVITLPEGVSAFVIYLLPVAFYYYFRRAQESEIHSVFVGIFLAGLVAGIFFAYDSFLKLALDQVSDYANEAYEYSFAKADATIEDFNDARIKRDSRSFGLLETHSVSGAWLVLSACAALALLPEDRQILRRGIFIIFGTLLLLALNFTSIVAYLIIMVFFEFGGIAIIRSKYSSGTLVSIIIGILLTLIAVALGFSIAGDSMSSSMGENLSFQGNLLLGTGNLDRSMLGLMFIYIERYLSHVFEFPFTIIIGDGFSSFGLLKGGDIGFVETVAKFGVPLSLLVILVLLQSIRVGLRRLSTASSHEGGLRTHVSQKSCIKFSLSILFLVVITEGHYGIWHAKSILPIVFFSLALLERYIPYDSSPLIPRSR
jgi:hypothetical protein